jgi:hypothetical protein
MLGWLFFEFTVAGVVANIVAHRFLEWWDGK